MTRTTGCAFSYSPRKEFVMGRLAKVMQGQSQPGLKAFKKGGMVKFETSAKDVEMKGAKEGSRKEEAMDRKQMKCAGGKVKK